VTESININSLAYHHIWSTIKTLPATLPEPSFEIQEPTLSNIATATSALGPRPGLLRAFLSQIWTLLKGGRMVRGFFAHFETLL
jgi:hypothetical protein